MGATSGSVLFYFKVKGIVPNLQKWFLSYLDNTSDVILLY